MNTSTAVKEVLNENPYLLFYLSEGILNLSELANYIKSDVENRAFKDLTKSAVLSALQRINLSEIQFNSVDYSEHIGKVTLTSDISEVTVENSSKIDKTLAKVASMVSNQKRSYFSYIKGEWQTIILYSHGNEKIIREATRKFDVLYKFSEITKVSIELRNNHLKVPGIIAFVLMLLALKSINIIEVLSTSDELSIFIEKQEAGKVFKIISEFGSNF